MKMLLTTTLMGILLLALINCSDARPRRKGGKGSSDKGRCKKPLLCRVDFNGTTVFEQECGQPELFSCEEKPERRHHRRHRSESSPSSDSEEDDEVEEVRYICLPRECTESDDICTCDNDKFGDLRCDVTKDQRLYESACLVLDENQQPEKTSKCYNKPDHDQVVCNTTEGRVLDNGKTAFFCDRRPKDDVTTTDVPTTTAAPAPIDP